MPLVVEAVRGQRAIVTADREPAIRQVDGLAAAERVVDRRGVAVERDLADAVALVVEDGQVLAGQVVLVGVEVRERLVAEHDLVLAALTAASVKVSGVPCGSARCGR